jgi:O-antigen ligase
VGLNVEPVIGFYPGYTQVHLTTLPSMLYLVPFLLAVGITARWQGSSRFGQAWIWPALFLGIAMLVLALRRGILVAVVAAPFVLAFLLSFGPARRVVARRPVVLSALAVVSVLLAAGIGAVLLLHWRADNMVRFFLAGFGLGGNTEDPGATVRTLQLEDLLRAWTSSPIIGSGAGASVTTQVRDPEMPWAYELSYISLLLQTGLVGVLLYAAGVVWIVRAGIQMIRAGHPLGMRLVPILTAMACFLIANATNPYLAKWDFLWVIFLPVAYVNAWLIEHPEEPRRATSLLGVRLG